MSRETSPSIWVTLHKKKKKKSLIKFKLYGSKMGGMCNDDEKWNISFDHNSDKSTRVPKRGTDIPGGTQSNTFFGN